MSAFTNPTLAQVETEKEDQQKSPEIGAVEIGDKELEQYADLIIETLESEAASFFINNERDIGSAAQDMGVSPEDLEAADKEFGLSEELEQLETEAHGSVDDAEKGIIAAMQGGSERANDFTRTMLGYKREDMTGFVQRIRGKGNALYTSPDGEEFFVKHATRQQGQRDNIAGLTREREILEMLAGTGVTPRAGELKVYPSGNRARLIIEQLPGTSLDRISGSERENLLSNNKIEAAVLSTAEALKTVHQEGVLVVDVNDGSFLLNQDGSQIKARLVDFELALNLNADEPEEYERAFRWYSGKDAALILDEHNCQDPTLLRKAEISLWARTWAEYMVVGYIFRTVDLPPEKQAEFEAAREIIRPVLEQKITEIAKRSYQRLSQIPPEERYRELGSERDFIQEELANNLSQEIECQLIGISLQQKLDLQGIEVPQKITDFISRALSLKIDDRPSDFAGLEAV